MSNHDVISQLDRDRLLSVTTEVINTITSPAFVEKMRVARMAMADGGGYDTAAQLLSITALREAGANIPDDFRMSSRFFEDKTDGFRLDVAEPPAKDRHGVLKPAIGACGGAGGLTFCGCGGVQQ